MGFILLRLIARSSMRARAGAGQRGSQGNSDWGPRGGQGTGSRCGYVRSPHEVLGVRRGASKDEIISRYRELVRQYHPDKVTHMAPEFREVAERRMKEINAAYDALKRHAA